MKKSYESHVVARVPERNYPTYSEGNSLLRIGGVSHLVRVVGLKPTSLAVPNRAFYQLNYTRIFNFLHDTMRRKKKQVFRVCGRRCGHAQFCGSFSTDRFPPQATVPRTSGVPLLGEWMSRLSSQIKRNTTFTISRYSMFHFTFDTYQQTGILFAHRLTIS